MFKSQKKKKVILIIEDERSERQALVDKLERAGFATLEAEDGMQGLEVALKEHPDLILLDIVMPVMDGLKMLSILRKDSWGKNVHVIVLTNLTDIERASGPVGKSVHEYLVKSDWKIADVLKKVEDTFKKI